MADLENNKNVHFLSEKTNNERNTPLDRILQYFFKTEKGLAIFNKYSQYYTYHDNDKYIFSLPMERNAHLYFSDLSQGGKIKCFAPDFDKKDFAPLIQLIQENRDFLLQDSYFNESDFSNAPYSYILNHGFLCNYFRYDCIARLMSKFQQKVSYWALDNVFKIQHSKDKLYLSHIHWDRFSLIELTNLFVNSFGENINALPNSALIAELDMLIRCRLEVLERRHLTTVYCIRESGRIYQISKMNPEKEFWIFNNYNEYIETKPIDEAEQFFKLTPIKYIIFTKGKDTFIKTLSCTARIIEVPGQKGLTATDFEFIPNMSEKEKEEEAEKIIQRALHHSFLPLAKYQTGRAKKRFAQYLNFFNSEPKNLYL